MPTNYKTIINFRDGIQVDENDLISQNGLVGIGTTIPREELDIRGNLIVENQTNLRHVNVIGYATHYGNINVAVGYSVGIGTTVPEATFQVGVGTTGTTISADGTVTAVAFVGDGAALTNLPTSVWNNDNPGAGSTIYAFRPVGIAKTFPQADFAIGDLIEVDAISGVGTFQGLEAKNLTLSGNAQQGNLSMVGSISGVQTVTGSGNAEFTGVGSFGGLNIATGVMIGTTGGLTVKGSNKFIDFNGNFANVDRNTGIRFIETSGSVKSAILYNGSVTGTGGTEGGQIEIWGDNNTTYVPRVVVTREGNVGVGTSRARTNFALDVVGTGTFTGTVGASGGFIGNVIGDISGVAGLAQGLTGTPDIIVDEITSAGLNTVYIRNTGISTFGGELSVSNFIGVGETSSALGKGLGVIGDSDVDGDGTFSGNLSVGGNLSIGGTFGGSLDLTDATANELIVTGIISGTTGSNAILRDTTIDGPIVQTVTESASLGALTIGGTCVVNTTDIQFGSPAIQVAAAGTLFANLSGVVTTGGVVCQNLDVSGNFNYTGAGVVTFSSIELNGVTGVVSCGSIESSGTIECINLISSGGITTVANLSITDGTSTNLLLNKIGFNTDSIGVTEGIAFYDNAEIAMIGEAGIGIGTTSGGRSSDIDFYVGLRRDPLGEFIGGGAIFEGGVGIGTKVDLVDANRVEIYKNVTFFGNHTGIGGSDADGGDNISRVGFNTAEPETTIDMGESPGCLILPRRAGDNTPIGAKTGGLWFGRDDNELRFIDNNTSTVSISTILPRTHDSAQYIEELGFIGGVANNDADRAQLISSNVDNIIQPGIEFPGIAASTGFGTSHMLYNKAYNKHQYATQQGSSATDASIFRSYVSSATSALNIELDSTGTKVFITIAGVGSATLNLV